MGKEFDSEVGKVTLISCDDIIAFIGLCTDCKQTVANKLYS